MKTLMRIERKVIETIEVEDFTHDNIPGDTLRVKFLNKRKKDLVFEDMKMDGAGQEFFDFSPVEKREDGVVRVSFETELTDEEARLYYGDPDYD